MNIKLISASLIGIGSIGGAIAGGFYLFNRDTNKQLNNKPPSKSPTSTQTNLPSASAQPRG